jgi:phage shock protein A
MDYMNTETIKHLMEAAAAWPTNEEALMAIATVKDDCALAQKKERQAQTQATKLIHQVEDLEKKLEDMTKKYTNAKMKLSAYEKIYEHKKVK